MMKTQEVTSDESSLPDEDILFQPNTQALDDKETQEALNEAVMSGVEDANEIMARDVAQIL